MLTLTILVPIIVAFIEIIKGTKIIEKKFMPFIAIIIGIVLAVITAHIGECWKDAVILGITAGFTSVGLFSGFKNTLQKRK